MTYVVVVADRVSAAGLEILRSTPGIEVVDAAGKPDQVQENLPRAHALLVRSDTQVTADLIATAPLLRVIGRAGIGVDNIDVEAATHSGIAVLNAPAANTVSAGEHAMALLLGLVRRVPWAAESMRRGEWDRKAFSGTELRGKVLGIVGLGRIGTHLTGLARAFGMQIIAHDPFLPEQRAQELRVELCELDAMLVRADVVTLHLPLTDETRHLIDARRLGIMKRSAILINTARGGLVDEAALIKALESGALGGAAIDVFDTEPLPSDAPLRRVERAILTPHLAASTKEAQERVALEICTTVRNALLTGDVGGAVNVPGVHGEAMARLGPLLDLSRRLGQLAATIVGGRVEAIEVAYGGSDEEAPRPVKLAALEGALAAMGVGPVTLINSQTLAEERGIAHSRRASAPIPGFETTVGVTMRSGQRATSVAGALIGDRIRRGRVIRIDDYAVDIPADGYVLVLRNRDVPGVIGRVGMVLADAGVNIGSYHQSQRPDGGGRMALAAIVVDQPLGTEVLKKLEAVPDVTEVRFADLGTGK